MPNAQPAQAAAATNLEEPPQKKPCFVISPIGDEDTEIRKNADQVLKYIIKEALSDTYSVERADDISKPGLITLQVIERLLKAPMVVADLTDANANVYYELAIRHFAKKPVVHLISEGQKPPFDVAPMRYISYNLKDLDSVARAAEALRAQVVAIEAGEVTLTLIQLADMVTAPRGQDQNQFASFAIAIQSAVSNLQSDVRQLGTQVSDLTLSTLEQRLQSLKGKLALSPYTLEGVVHALSTNQRFSQAAAARHAKQDQERRAALKPNESSPSEEPSGTARAGLTPPPKFKI